MSVDRYLSPWRQRLRNKGVARFSLKGTTEVVWIFKSDLRRSISSPTYRIGYILPALSSNNGVFDVLLPKKNIGYSSIEEAQLEIDAMLVKNEFVLLTEEQYEKLVVLI
jgi:hypothetical protein